MFSHIILGFPRSLAAAAAATSEGTKDTFQERRKADIEEGAKEHEDESPEGEQRGVVEQVAVELPLG